jgi:hypothetical protein
VLYLPELGTTYSEPNDHKEQVCYNQSQFWAMPPESFLSPPRAWVCNCKDSPFFTAAFWKVGLSYKHQMCLGLWALLTAQPGLVTEHWTSGMENAVSLSWHHWFWQELPPCKTSKRPAVCLWMSL